MEHKVTFQEFLEKIGPIFKLVARGNAFIIEPVNYSVPAPHQDGSNQDEAKHTTESAIVRVTNSFNESTTERIFTTALTSNIPSNPNATEQQIEDYQSGNVIEAVMAVAQTGEKRQITSVTGQLICLQRVPKV